MRSTFELNLLNNFNEIDFKIVKDSLNINFNYSWAKPKNVGDCLDFEVWKECRTKNKLLQIKLEVQLSSEKVTSQQWKSKWEMHLNMKDPKKPQMTLWTLQKYWREVQIWYFPSFVFVFGSVSVYFFICLSVSHPQRTKRQASFVQLSFCPSIHPFPRHFNLLRWSKFENSSLGFFLSTKSLFFFVFPTFYENFRLGGVCVSPM